MPQKPIKNKTFEYLLILITLLFFSGCGLEYGVCGSGENVKQLFSNFGDPLPSPIQIKKNESFSYDLENRYYIGIKTGRRQECEEIGREPLQVDSIKVGFESIATVNITEQYFLNVVAIDTGKTSFTIFLTADLGYGEAGRTIYNRKVSGDIVVTQ